MAALTDDLAANIEAYLLGRLPDEERERIEALLFDDEDAFEAIRDAEDDLIDRYVAGELTPEDRDAFEHAFAISTSRQQRIALARTLAQGLATGAATTGAAATGAAAAAGAAASGAAAPGAARLGASSSGTTTRGNPVPGAASPGAPSPARVETSRSPSRRSSAVRRIVVPAGATLAAVLVLTLAWRARLLETSSPSAPAAGDAASGSGEIVRAPSDGTAIATFSLARIELRRGAGDVPRLALPSGTTAIRLQPEIETPSPGERYAVTLRRVEGRVVWQETAHPDVASGRISITVPARLMGPGDYVMSLAVPGTPPEDSADYPFRIVARD